MKTPTTPRQNQAYAFVFLGMYWLGRNPRLSDCDMNIRIPLLPHIVKEMFSIAVRASAIVVGLAVLNAILISINAIASTSISVFSSSAELMVNAFKTVVPRLMLNV